MGEFIKQFYNQAPTVPAQVLLPQEVEEAQIIRTWLSSRRDDHKIEILVPRKGPQHELIEMAAENAAETLHALQTQWNADKHKQEQALSELQSALGLTNPLNRIECYDISNIQGTAAVGSMVVFEQGVPKKAFYRRFNIRSVSGPDDFASMEEVLMRRFNRWKAAQEVAETPGKKPDPSFAMLPDFLIVDGGKGQMGRAVGVMEKFALGGKIPLAGLAKQNEALFLPGQADPLVLGRQSQALYLIQRIRDEAHRFAISAHRNRRAKLGLASRLDKVPGIGPARRKALLGKFGSIEGILGASAEELAQTPGIPANLAHTIKEILE